MEPLVGIIIGSDSDLGVMSKTAEILDKLEIPYEFSIISAHRTPDRMYEYARQARKRGLKAIIAGAGGAAHVPGMVAAMTTVPVIGVPIQAKALDGMDALFSICQMPPGIPVATVAINGALNAGILAAKIIATNDEALAAGKHRLQRVFKADAVKIIIKNDSHKLKITKHVYHITTT